MGYGDELLGSGMARGAAARGRRIAFGDGKTISWSKEAYEIFRGNPNVAPPGSEAEDDLDWIPHYRGRRLYAKPVNGRWAFNDAFRAVPGELFLDLKERMSAERAGVGFAVIEPNVKATAPNKQWPFERYQAVADRLRRDIDVVQFDIGRRMLKGVRSVKTEDFRTAAAMLARAWLYVGPEGGLHHAAAAVGTNAVVIFGGFIDPHLTGYEMHVNLFSGSACGQMQPCLHCRRAMEAISIDEVTEAAQGLLHG